MNKKKLYIISLFFLAFLIYIYILFPFIEKDLKKEPVYINSELWLEDNFKVPKYYYLENEKNINYNDLKKNLIDSIFVVDYLKSHRNSVTLKNPQITKIPFTNNYTSTSLKCYSLFQKTKDERYLDLFLMSANWMKRNVKIVKDSVALWTNDNMIYDKYSLNYAWSSAYGQGFGLSVMTRAYMVTGDSSFIKIGEKVLNSFLLDYREGGISYRDSTGNLWYFEYPAKKPGYVLNGMIFGLFGIYDFYRITNSQKAYYLFSEGVKTLKRNIHKYDKGYWSAYDLEYNRFCASYGYHKNVHIPQLKALYHITNEKIFKSYSEKFTKYLDEPYLTIFKISFTIDAFERWTTYKFPFNYLTKERFDENNKK